MQNALHPFFSVLGMLGQLPEKGKAPKPCQADQRIDDAAYEGGLSAEDGRDDIKLEKPHEQPVERSDNHKNQRSNIQTINSFRSVVCSQMCKLNARHGFSVIYSTSIQSNLTGSIKSEGKNFVRPN